MRRKAYVSRKVLTKGNTKQVISNIGKPETKYFDGRSNISLGQVWTMIPLPNMRLGTDSTERIGDKIKVISIDLRMFILLRDQSLPGNDFGDQVRVCFIQDKQSNGQTITGLNVFTTNTYTSFQNALTNDRFVRLKDKLSNPVEPRSLDSIGVSSETVALNIHYSREPIMVSFLNNNGNASSYLTNALWIGMVSINGVTDIYYTYRLRYVDF